MFVEEDSLDTERRMAWNEENRLMALSDNCKISRYTYNAAGERIIKSHRDLESVYVNGAP
ncbi:hypothetical protein HMPREF2955_04720 [Prevotella sp. HMSC073D09]|nr:hypothetical protein HMPREF2955_04720 [Prevotella sp. HMSC073D09]